MADRTIGMRRGEEAFPKDPVYQLMECVVRYPEFERIRVKINRD